MDFTVQRFYNKSGIERFIKVYTFSQTDSSLISKALPERRLYFSDTGELLITESASSKTKVLSHKVALVQNTLSTLAVESNLVHKAFDDQTFFFSKDLGLWVLCLEPTGSYSIRYNPVPRQEYLKYFKSDENNSISLLLDYCKEVRGFDPVCSCINRENPDLNIQNEDENKQFCMNSLLGGNKTRTNIKKASSGMEYKAIASNCACLNIQCPREKHPIQKEINTRVPCPGTVLSICNTNISSGRDISSLGMEIEQRCGVNTGGSGSTPGGSGSTPGGSGSGSTPGGSGSGSGSGTDKDKQENKGEVQLNAKKSLTIYFVIGGGFFLILLIIIGILFLRNKNLSTALSTTTTVSTPVV
jgi:uncharacterized membrane protein YgcG